jgi:sialic acid synthase SpsE
MTIDLLLGRDVPIGPNSVPFVIAEMSGNHNQSLERALEIVDAAAKAGVPLKMARLRLAASFPSIHQAD